MIRLRTLGVVDLRGSDGRAIESVLTQPKRLALLVYLVVASPRGFHRRDRLLALLWPELDQEHARAALRKALFHLRRSLGANVLVGRGDEEVGVAEGALWCDAVALVDALREGRAAEGLELYGGDLLPGFFIAEGPEFERWLERERERLRTRAADAAWTMAAERQAAGDSRAVEWARRAAALEPESEVAFRNLLSVLDWAGDRAGAVSAYEEFRHRLAEELLVEPSSETQALMDSIRHGRGETAVQAAPARPPGDEATGHPPGAWPSPSPASPPTPGVAAAWGRRRALARPRTAAWVLLGCLAAAALGIASLVSRRSPPPVLAIGHIRDYTGGDSASFAGLIPDLLATSLSRAPGLHVVSPARVHELLDEGKRFDDPPALLEAARRAGATQILDGAMYRVEGAYRLDLHWVRIRDGALRASYSVVGGDPFVLVDAATARILSGRGDVISPGIADVTTTSVVAYRFFQEGVWAYYQGDNVGAQRLLLAALEEDSTFAMASYYAALAHFSDAPTAESYLARAVRLARNASDRERLLIRGVWADMMNDPARLAIAETLAVRYPQEPDGHVLLGRAKVWSGDFLGAIPHLRRAIAMDSAGMAIRGSRCRACEAFSLSVLAYLFADSLAAAERTASEWGRWMPRSVGALDMLANTLAGQGRFGEALTVRQRIAELQPGSSLPRPEWWQAIYAVQQGDFARADRLLRTYAEAGTAGERREALWYRIISLRNQGRLRDALSAARELRTMTDPPRPTGAPPSMEALAEAVVLSELERGREAAALWDSIARAEPHPSPTWRARHRAWMLTHAATALHAVGDTGSLAGLAEQIARYGRQSAYGRDARLHHHVQGLLWSARGDMDKAVSAFRDAIFSPVGGYTRTNLELARALMRLDRPLEAAEILRPALRGGIEASNLYVTATELHEALGLAFDRAGEADSAAVHYRRVARAWQSADPIFQGRLEWVQRRLATLQR